MSNPTGGHQAWINGLLFGLTVVTTWLAGGFLYALPLMIILAGHELGHYLTCRRYGVDATYPFFIPGPPLLGTFGAFIRIKSPVYLKRQIFDVGANGPLTGFALAVPALILGLALSKVGPLPAAPETISFGEPLLLRALIGLFFGPVPEGSSVILHPVGFAGWVGLLVTALNLTPIGQLDGGHVAYAILGRRAGLLSRIMIGSLVLMGLFFHLTWLVLAVVILVLELRSKTRLRHPPVLDEGAPLGRKRTVLSFVLLLIFVLSFIPDPVKGFSLLDLLRGSAGPAG